MGLCVYVYCHFSKFLPHKFVCLYPSYVCILFSFSHVHIIVLSDILPVCPVTALVHTLGCYFSLTGMVLQKNPLLLLINTKKFFFVLHLWQRMSPFLIPPPLGQPHSVFGGTSACWLFSCFHNPPNSGMDYMIFNLHHTWSFVCMCTYTRGVGHTDSESGQPF